MRSAEIQHVSRTWMYIHPFTRRKRGRSEGHVGTLGDHTMQRFSPQLLLLDVLPVSSLTQISCRLFELVPSIHEALIVGGLDPAGITARLISCAFPAGPARRICNLFRSAWGPNAAGTAVLEMSQIDPNHHLVDHAAQDGQLDLFGISTAPGPADNGLVPDDFVDPGLVDPAGVLKIRLHVAAEAVEIDLRFVAASGPAVLGESAGERGRATGFGSLGNQFREEGLAGGAFVKAVLQEPEIQQQFWNWDVTV
jgi:hypothetical protein